MIKFDLFCVFGVDIYLKDESIYFTGFFKYCFVCLLFLYGLCNGWIGLEIIIIEFLFGSIVVLEVYFVCLFGLFFIVVMLKCIVCKKIE